MKVVLREAYLAEVVEAIAEYVRSGHHAALHSERINGRLAITMTLDDPDAYHELQRAAGAGDTELLDAAEASFGWS